MRIHGGLVLVAGLACALQAAAAVPPPEILVLSNRADLISGGDALVEIKMPAVLHAAGGQDHAEWRSRQSVLRVAPEWSLHGRGQRSQGRDECAGRAGTRRPGGADHRSPTIRSAVRVFAGPQLQPWICATRVATTVTVVGNPGSTPPTATATTRASGLNDDPTDEKCDTPPTYTYFYQPVGPARQQLHLRDFRHQRVLYGTMPGPRAVLRTAAIANFTNDRGDTVKSMIRVERGSINRTHLHARDLLRSGDANTPWAPPKGWNGKLVWQFGPSAAVSRFESITGEAACSTRRAAWGCRGAS